LKIATLGDYRFPEFHRKVKSGQSRKLVSQLPVFHLGIT
jgi:hypothetical protein